MNDKSKLLLAGGLLFVAWWMNFTKSGKSLSLDIGGGVMSAINSISENGLQLIRDIESFSSKPYKDAGGWSIGYGHYMGPTPTINFVTPQQGEEFLKSDTASAAKTVASAVKVPLNQNQFDALVSFVYNIGAGNFKSSTLLKLLNSGDYQGAADQFKYWNKSRGKILTSLVNRREREKALFLS